MILQRRISAEGMCYYLFAIIFLSTPFACLQTTEQEDYQPRYNPQYMALQQQNEIDYTQYDNSIFATLQEHNQTGFMKNSIGSLSNEYNQYFRSNSITGFNTNHDDFILNNSSFTYHDDYHDENNFCPEYWIAFQQICYRFIFSPKRNWFHSKQICNAYNANLVNMDSVEKHSFILKKLILQNQYQNRFWISARQIGTNNWVNDDNTPFFDDSIALNETRAIESGDLHVNQHLVQGNYNPNEHYHHIDESISKRKQNSLRGFGVFDQQSNHNIIRDRLVYAYSENRKRWVFMPVNAEDLNLFICESRYLHNAENIYVKNDNKRQFHYGINVKDYKQIPRGPYFVKQPIDTIFDTSKNRIINDVTLSCLASGYPTPTYRWFRERYVNDTLEYKIIDPLQNIRYTLSGGNLIIYDPKQEWDQGVYHCVAENIFGRIRSESVNLNFGFIMEFNLKRSEEIGEMNWGKSLFCDPPQHYPQVKYYWSRDFFPNFVEEDQRVFVSHDGALYFSYIETVDQANYSCTVQTLVSDTGRNGPFFPLRVRPNSNYQALIFANSFPKVFPEAPVAGEDVRLECMAFGYPIPFYNWTRKGQPLQINAHMFNYNRVLIIQNASIDDNGEYICTISNSQKTHEKSIYINIQVQPVFIVPLQNRVKDYHAEVMFVCEAFAVPDVNYTWYRNAEHLNTELIDKDRFIIQDNLLIIKHLNSDDNAIYQCGATNQLKTSYSSAQLRVLSLKPSFKKRPLDSEIYAVYNSNTSIICDPEAAPHPKIQWKKNGQAITTSENRKIYSTGTLNIYPTTWNDEGIYTCVAINQEGVDESTTRLLVLQELRFIQTPPLRIVAQIRDILHLQCEVTHDQLLDVAYVWKHNGEVLQNDSDNPPNTERIFVNYNRLTVYNVSFLDGGEYECLVKTSVNEIAAKTNVVIQSPPGAPGGVQVIDIGKTSAIIQWVNGATNGRPILYYNILGRTNWNRTWINVSTHLQAQEVDRHSNRQQAEVTQLTPWSAYEFSVVAVNDLGIGKASAPSPIYSTHEDKPYTAPINVGGGGGKIGDLTITWDPLLPEDQHSRGIHYIVFWRLKTKYEWATEVIKRKDDIGMAVVNIPLNNYYTEYEVKVQAVNNIGKGPESEIVTVYSAEDMPQIAPQKVVPLAYNSTAFNVTWEPIEITRENIRGKLIGHRIKYWKTTHKEEDAVYYLSRTTRNWALIVGLQPDTYYFVKVMAYNAAGEGPESERTEERTYRKAPQKPPSSVHVYGINPSTVRVVWRYISPEQDEEPIEGYKVRIWEGDQNMITANDTVIQIGNKLEAYISTLTPGKSYNMRVLAFSNGGDGRMSSPTIRFQMGKTTRNSAVNCRGALGKIFVIIILHTSFRNI